MSASNTLTDRHISTTVQPPTTLPCRPSVFKRLQTVSSLSNVGTVPPHDAPDKSPTHINHPTPGGGSAADEQRRIRDSFRRQHPAKSATAIKAVTTTDLEPGATAAATVVNSQRPVRKLQNRLSGEGVPLPSIAQPQQPLRKLGRTPSSPSVLFSRVKERIREKVFETSAEWPHMAAVERERRIRAAQAFEQALRDSMAAYSNSKYTSQSQRQGGHHLPLVRTTATMGTSAADDSTSVSAGERTTTSGGEKTRRVRQRSDPSRRTFVGVSSMENREVEDSQPKQLPQPSSSMLARLAFRRRSISEDTYILETKMVAAAAASAETTCDGRLLGPDSSGRTNSQGDGIVCSNEDLKEIVNRHKARRSPLTSPTKTLSESHPASVQQLSISDDVLVRVVSSTACGGAGGPDSLIMTGSSMMTSDWTSNVDDIDKSDAVMIVGREQVGDVSICGPPTRGPSERAVIGGVPVPGGHLDNVDCVEPHADNVDETIVDENNDDIATKKKANSVTVRDVVYDEHGQTWDIYGADFDPEILGQAIQAYLEKLMSKTLRKRVSHEMTIANEITNDAESRNPGVTEGRQTGRSFGVLIRHLCSPLWRQQHQPTTTNS